MIVLASDELTYKILLKPIKFVKVIIWLLTTKR